MPRSLWSYFHCSNCAESPVLVSRISMNSAPVMVSFSQRNRESSRSLSSFARRRFRAFSCWALTVSTTIWSIFAEVSGAQIREVSPPIYWLVTVSRATMSKSPLMPYRVIMARASLVAFSMSLEAPVVMDWNTSSSAARPPVRVAIWFSSSSRLMRLRSSCSTCMV